MFECCCKAFQTIRNYQDISFNLKFVILDQKQAIWLRRDESDPLRALQGTKYLNPNKAKRKFDMFCQTLVKNFYF